MTHEPKNEQTGLEGLEEALRGLQPADPPALLELRLSRELDEEAPGCAEEKAGALLPFPGLAESAIPETDAGFYEAGASFRRSRFLRFLTVPGAAAAVVIAALSFALLRDSRTAVPESDGPATPGGGFVDMGTEGDFIEPNVARFQPGSARTILYDILDEGIVWNDNDKPMRQFRYRFLESVSLRNPSDGSVLRMDIPREEVVRVPVETF